MKVICAVVAAGLLASAAAPSLAQSGKGYPEKPVRIVVPWAAGGNIDVLTRILTQRLAQVWGQQIIVDNRGGATGMIGSEIVVRSAPDGYTMVVDGLQTHAINPFIYAKMAYDTQRDLAPITLMGAVKHILVRKNEGVGRRQQIPVQGDPRLAYAGGTIKGARLRRNQCVRVHGAGRYAAGDHQ